MLYEVDSLSILVGPDYLAKANNPSPLTRRTTRLIRNSIRALANVELSLGIGEGGFVLTLRFDPQEGRDADLRRYVTEEALPSVARMPEIAAVHFCVADKPASTMVPVERQGRPTVVPNWIVIAEGITLESVDRITDGLLSDEKLRGHGCGGAVDRDIYSLQIAVSKPGPQH